MKEVTPPEPSNIALPFWIKVARGVGEARLREAYTDDELFVSLGNSLKLHEQSVRESRSFWGKFKSLFARRVDSDNIEIDGMRLQQLLAIAGTMPSADISVSKTYLLDLAVFRSLLKSATDNLTERRLSAGDDVRD